MSKALRLHLWITLIAFSDLLLFIGAGISFTGQWVDIALSLLPFITALGALRFYRSLRAGYKIYLVAFLIFQTLSSPLYLFFTIPVYLTPIAESGRYELRGRAGVLAPPGGILIKKTFLFEEVRSGFLLTYERQVRMSVTDSVRVQLCGSGRDTTYVFPK